MYMWCIYKVDTADFWQIVLHIYIYIYLCTYNVYVYIHICICGVYTRSIQLTLDKLSFIYIYIYLYTYDVYIYLHTCICGVYTMSIQPTFWQIVYIYICIEIYIYMYIYAYIHNVYTADFWQIVLHALRLRHGVVYIQCVYSWLCTIVKTQLYRHCKISDKRFTRPVAQAWCGVNTMCIQMCVAVCCSVLQCVAVCCSVWCQYDVYTDDFWQTSNSAAIDIVWRLTNCLTCPMAQAWCIWEVGGWGRVSFSRI